MCSRAAGSRRSKSAGSSALAKSLIRKMRAPERMAWRGSRERQMTGAPSFPESAFPSCSARSLMKVPGSSSTMWAFSGAAALLSRTASRARSRVRKAWAGEEPSAVSSPDGPTKNKISPACAQDQAPASKTNTATSRRRAPGIIRKSYRASCSRQRGPESFNARLSQSRLRLSSPMAGRLDPWSTRSRCAGSRPVGSGP